MYATDRKAARRSAGQRGPRSSPRSRASGARNPVLNPQMWEYGGRLAFHPPSLAEDLGNDDWDVLNRASWGGCRPAESRYALGVPVHFHLGEGSRGAAATYGPSEAGRGVDLHVYALADRRTGNTYRWRGAGDSAGPPQVPLELSRTIADGLSAWSARFQARELSNDLPEYATEVPSRTAPGPGERPARRTREDKADYAAFFVSVERAVLQALDDTPSPDVRPRRQITVSDTATANADRCAGRYSDIADMLRLLAASRPNILEMDELLSRLPRGARINARRDLSRLDIRMDYARLLMDYLDETGLKQAALDAVGTCERRSRFINALIADGIRSRSARSAANALSQLREALETCARRRTHRSQEWWTRYAWPGLTGLSLSLSAATVATYLTDSTYPVGATLLGLGAGLVLAALVQLAARYERRVMYYGLTRGMREADGESSDDDSAEEDRAPSGVAGGAALR